MCWISDLFKKKLTVILGQVDTIPGCDPTQDWLAGKMPSYSIPKLIKHLDFRKSIHETYYGLITEGKFDPHAGYGDANFQLWAIEGYVNAIYYLKKLQEVQA